MSTIRPRKYDMKSLKLSAEEGFVLSRVDGPVSLADLAAVSGIEEARLVEIVDKLASQGAIEVEGRPVVEAPPPPPVVVPTPSIMPIAELEELEEVPSDPIVVLPPVAPAPTPSIMPIAELEGIEELPVAASLAVRGVCDMGKVRTNNEDALAVVDLTSSVLVDVLEKSTSLEAVGRGILLAVADGMGGENAGEVASAMVLETLRSHLQAHADEEAGAALAAAAQHANVRVIAAAEKHGLSGMGSTLVAVLVSGTSAVTAEVGDSRAYVLRAGKLTQLSRDQTQGQVLVDQGLMTAEDMKKSRAKNILLQACGKQPELVVAQRQLELRLGDRLLLCSDGLPLHVEDEEITTILTSLPSPDEASAHLVTLTNERGGRDNVTVLVADVGGPLAPPGPNEPVTDTLTLLREFSTGEPEPGEGDSPA